MSENTPTMSPDGKYMWNGTEWIPAPPAAAAPEANRDAVRGLLLCVAMMVVFGALSVVVPFFLAFVGIGLIGAVIFFLRLPARKP